MQIFMDLKFSIWKLQAVEVEPCLAKKAKKRKKKRTSDYIFLYRLDPDFFEASIIINDESWFHHNTRGTTISIFAMASCMNAETPKNHTKTECRQGFSSKFSSSYSGQQGNIVK